MPYLIETKLTMRCRVESIWQLLQCTRDYPEWNPFIIRMTAPEGFRVGATFRFVVQPLNSPPLPFQARVTELIPNQRLRWRGKFFIRGIYDGDHLIETLPGSSSGEVIFIHSEAISGLIPSLLHSVRVATKRGFDAMNHSIKTRVEAGS